MTERFDAVLGPAARVARREGVEVHGGGSSSCARPAPSAGSIRCARAGPALEERVASAIPIRRSRRFRHTVPRQRRSAASTASPVCWPTDEESASPSRHSGYADENRVGGDKPASAAVAASPGRLMYRDNATVRSEYGHRWRHRFHRRVASATSALRPFRKQ